VKRWGVLAALLVGVVVRLPFWMEALRTPVDGDTAIIGLMARHPLSSATMWGQPYGSPVDAWLAAPVLAVVGRTPTGLRVFYFVLGLALIPLAAALARRLDPRAAVPAALLMACPSPYLVLLAALPAPFYPTVLVSCGGLLVLTLKMVETAQAGRAPAAWAVAGWGALAGLSLWTHLMSAAVVAPAAVYLLRRVPVRSLRPAGAAAALASAPVWWRALTEAQALKVVSVSGRHEGMLEHLQALVPEMHRPVTGLLGTHVPWIPDDPSYVTFAPTLVAGLAVLLYCGGLLLAARASRLGGHAGLLLAVVALVVLVFPLPLRANPSAIRFLTPAYLPVVALVAWACVQAGRIRHGIAAVLALSSLHLVVSARLLGDWQKADRAEAPFLLPDLGPVRRELEAHAIKRAYASYGPAYRLTFESGERIIASQPWNERFLHYPLPYLDEVRFSKNVAWILTPGIPTDLPTPKDFEDQLGAIGGRFDRHTVGTAVLFHSFEPPFGPSVAELPRSADGAATWPVEPPRRLGGVTLVADRTGARLPRSFDLEISEDGVTFERIARRRRREERRDLRWVGGHPQYVLDDDFVAATAPDRVVAAVRVRPMDGEEGVVAKVLAHDAGAPEARWDEWLDPHLAWSGRLRALEEAPHPERADWHYRLLLADRHR
jgi:hypothetical protein